MTGEKGGSLGSRLREQLGARAEILDVVVQEACARGARPHLVGGPVRDLLLGVPIGDLDMLLSDQLEPVAKASAKRLGGRAVLRPRFLTASLELEDDRVDISLARRERYVRPGALPEVEEAASVEEDLQRRDFSINALALRLERASVGPILDPLGGQKDLAARRLRILHEASFRDDPTRLWRAARYAARLGLRFEAQTRRTFRDACDQAALDTVSGARIFNEIQHLWKESALAKACSHADRLGLFTATQQGWCLGEAARSGLRRLQQASVTPPWPEVDAAVRWAGGLRLLLLGTTQIKRRAILRRLGLGGRRATQLEVDLGALSRLRRSLQGERASPGTLDSKLGEVSEPGLLLLYCATRAPAPRRVRDYASRLRHVPNPLDGHAARRLGLQGPPVGELVRDARRRALDGREVDEAWLQGWLARRRGIR